LIECDPSIKSIIVNIDSKNHDFIIEDLDEERVVVKENMVPLLKEKLEEVCANTFSPTGSLHLVFEQKNRSDAYSTFLRYSACPRTFRPLTSLAPNETTTTIRVVRFTM
jgi:TFIIH basal transcription factor complex TTD-A subunit